MPEHDKYYADKRFSYYGPNGRGVSSSAFELMAYPNEISAYRQYADETLHEVIPDELMESAAAEAIASIPHEQEEAANQEEPPINMQERV
jgi:hypothetical protein